MSSSTSSELPLQELRCEDAIPWGRTRVTEPRLFDDAEPHADAPDDAPFTVEVQRSARRRRTVGARIAGNVLRITIPAWMSHAEQDHWVDVMSARFRRKLSTDRIDLDARAALLARRHDLAQPESIRWSDDMNSRWGSCTPATATIRVSSRVATFPDWVVDYVLVHELAHLTIASHSKAFWKIVHRYPKSERAIGYLIAKSGAEDCCTD